VAHNATNEERDRWQYFREIGCIACSLEGGMRGEDRSGTPADVHHLINGYRAGHGATIPLCPWHHRGVKPDETRATQETRDTLGPSLALAPEQFRNRYGGDAFLLDATNRLITVTLQTEQATN